MAATTSIEICYILAITIFDEDIVLLAERTYSAFRGCRPLFAPSSFPKQLLARTYQKRTSLLASTSPLYISIMVAQLYISELISLSSFVSNSLTNVYYSISHLRLSIVYSQ